MSVGPLLWSATDKERTMATYLVLYLSSATAQEQMASATPEQGQEGMEEWTRWADRAGAAVVDIGQPLSHAFTVPDGSAPRQGLHVGGYSIMQAESADELTGVLADHPHLKAPGGAIEVYAALDVPGM
jgi:hypothetical protein